MKKNLAGALVVLTVVLAGLAGCKKSDTTNTTQTPTVSTTQLFNYSDAWGLLAGVKTVTYQPIPVIGGVQEIDLGTAVAAFNTAAGSNTYQEAGTITCNSKALTKQSNNSYIFTPTQTDLTGIDFGSGSAWQVSGAGSVPAINRSFNRFPSSPTITSNTDEVTIANGYTFTVSGLSGADSVLFVLASGNSFVQKRVGPYTNSVTFSASELSSLGTSDYGLLQVTPYTYEVNTSLLGGGKKLYFINQVTVSDFAKFK